MPDANLFPTDEVIQLALTDDFSMDSVTSGSDPNLWDPIQILDGEQADEPQKKKEKAQGHGRLDGPGELRRRHQRRRFRSLG